MSSNYSQYSILGQIKTLFTILLIGIVVFALGYYLSHKKATEQYRLLLSEKTAAISGLKIAKTKTTTLDKLLKQSASDSEELKQIIKSLKDTPPQIEYIVKTKTVLKKSEPKVIRTISKCEIPKAYSYKLESGLKVAEFKTSEQDDKVLIQHNTADLTFTSTIITGPDRSGVLFKAFSSLEPEKEYVLATRDFSVTKIRKFNIFEPHLMLGLDLNISKNLQTSITGSLSVPMLHLIDKRLDILGPKISFSDESVGFGLGLAYYNIGYHVPILTDLWLSTGISLLSSTDYISFDLSVGSKF